MKRDLKTKILKWTGTASCAVGSVFASAGQVFASDAFSNITGKPSGNDIFGGLTKTVVEIGNSAINLLTIGGAILVVIGLLLCGFGLIVFKGDTEVSKGKKHLLVIIGASALIFGAMGIGRGFAKIGQSVGDSLQSSQQTSTSSAETSNTVEEPAQ